MGTMAKSIKSYIKDHNIRVEITRDREATGEGRA